jgi:hypothetical protein
MSLIRKKNDATQFLWVTINPTYKRTTGKLNVQYALFTYVSICSFWFFDFEYSNEKKSIASSENGTFWVVSLFFRISDVFNTRPKCSSVRTAYATMLGGGGRITGNKHSKEEWET